MSRLEKLQALLGEEDVADVASSLPASFGKACNIYEGSDDDSDDCEPVKSKKNKNSQFAKENGIPAKEFVPNDFPEYQLEYGQLATEGEPFCPWQVLRRYPYVYIGGGNKDKVCSGFFDGNLIYQYTWDFFYIYRPEKEQNQEPILLVPAKQFEHFLDLINSKLNINLSIPSGGANGAFQVTFENDGTPQPRYLGRSTNKDMADDHKKAVPPRYFTLSGEPEPPTPSNRSLLSFKAKMDLIFQAKKGQKLAAKDKQRKDRHSKQQSWNHSVKRVQRYLGLREASKGDDALLQRWPQDDPDRLLPPLIFTPDKLAPFPNERSVVFICVDVEAFERNNNIITEIGIATLDTDDLKQMEPGNNAENWRKAVRARHFRIKEHVNMVNKDFVQGCADSFEFGDSEFINLKDAPQVVSSCFKPPYSRPDSEAQIMGDDPNQKRNLILVGHDIEADINYLKKIGYEVRNLSNLVEIIDTRVMWASLKRDSSFRSLGAILAELEILGWNLHNAGNDAAYTLHAMMAITAKQLVDRQKSREQKEEAKNQRLAESISEAIQCALEKEEGWSSGGNDSDGGPPVALVDPNEKKTEQNKPGYRGSLKYSENPWKKGGSPVKKQQPKTWVRNQQSDNGEATRGWNNFAGTRGSQSNTVERSGLSVTARPVSPNVGRGTSSTNASRNSPNKSSRPRRRKEKNEELTGW